METNLLFYKIQKRTVTVHDYINWSHGLLGKEISLPSLKILSSCSSFDNIFEIESYFKRAVNELGIERPTFEACARANIDFLAMKIMETDDYKQIYHLVDRIFKVVVVGLDYQEDSLPWIELTERMDKVDYHNDRDVIIAIKNEAKSLLTSE